VVKQRTRREHQSTRLSDPIREVLAAWIIAVFSLATGLSVPRWYARPVIGSEDWHEADCGAGIRSCLGELAAADDGASLKITQSQGDSDCLGSFSKCGRAQELSRR